MDVRFINPFLQAADKVFGVVVNVPVTVLHTMATRGLPCDPNMVNAVVELHGEVEGVVVLRFSSRVVYGVAEAFAGTTVSEADAQDAIGELANMIAGSAKQNLYGRFATLSIPRVVAGDVSQLHGVGDATWLVTSFSSRVGDFHVAVSLLMSQSLTRV